MNSKLMTHKPAIRNYDSSRISLTIALAILALVLVAAGVALWQGTAQPTTEAASAELSPGLNPELSAARRYAAEKPALSDEAYRNHPSYLAANPELMKAAPQVVRQGPASEGTALGDNPELFVARRYAEQKSGE